MEALIFLLLLIVVVIYFVSKVSQKNRMQNIAEAVNRLSKQNSEIREKLDALINQVKSSSIEVAKPTESQLVSEPVPIPKPDPVTPVSPPVQNPIPAEPIPIQIQKPETEPLNQSITRPAIPSVTLNRNSSTPADGWWTRWMRNNPDLEKFIGENLINKIGIAVLVLGIAFFVKYAIDQNWINEAGRVSIGLFCGAILVGLAHYMRNSYRAFSSVLAGGGIAVFYFTIAFAFHQYQLLSQTAAFVIMVIITAFAVLLSILYDKMELAVIAAIGGFLTPIMVSTGGGNYIVLLSYIIILNSGLLLLAYFKRWPLLNVISLAFTVILISGWITRTLQQEVSNVSYPLALLLITILYLEFLAMNMVNQVKLSKPFKALDFSLLLFLTAAYYAAGMVLLSQVNGGAYRGLFTLLAALVNLSLAWYFFKRKDTDHNLLYLLIGLTLTLISLAVPVQLQGHTITMFYSAEMVLLFWLYQRSKIPLFRVAAVITAVLALSSLAMDWSLAEVSDASTLALIFTDWRGLVTNVVAFISFGLFSRLLQKEEPLQLFVGILPNRTMKHAALSIAVILLYITLIFSVNLVFRNENGYMVPNVYHQLMTYLLSLFLMLWTGSRTVSRIVLQMGIVMFCLLFYLFSSYLSQDLQEAVAAGTRNRIHLYMHWLSALLLLFLFYRVVQLIRNNKPLLNRYLPAISWMLSIAIVTVVSIEGYYMYMSTSFSSRNPILHRTQFMKAVLTIIWAICSFMIMWFGMKFKNKTLRIISLSVFTVSLIKLFFFDIRNISEGGKIAAFILLGVLLLTISFMYQKLKKIIIDEARS